MYIVLAIVGILVVLVATVLIVGKSLPVAHVARARATFKRPRAEVWSALTNFADYPAWRRGVAQAEPLDANKKLWKESNAKGEGMTYETVQVEADSRLVRRIADRNLPFGGQWVFEVREDGPNQTTVDVIEEGEVYNPVFRFVSRYVMGHHATLQGFLQDLGKKLGDEAQIQKE